MDISPVNNVAAAFEGSRVAGQQQASSTVAGDQTRRQNEKKVQEADLKQTDVVQENNGNSQSSESNGRKLNILA
jgi:hypothetical protein